MPASYEDYCKCVMVTGGAGFIGSHIVEELLKGAEGMFPCEHVVVYDKFASETSKNEDNAAMLRKTAEESGTKITVVQADLRDQYTLMGTIRKLGVTACIHLGGMSDNTAKSIANPTDYIDVNILGTALLLDALGKCGVKHVVQASNKSIYGQCPDTTDGSTNDKLPRTLDEKAARRPTDPSGASRVGADAMAHCFSHVHDMNVSLVRVFGTYGPRGRPDMLPRILIENIFNDKPIRKYGDGTATRSWTYISDIVSAFLMALKHQHQHLHGNTFAEFNTGALQATTLNEMIECAEKVTGKKAIIVQSSIPKGDVHTFGKPSYDHMEKVIGWTPKVDIMEGMRLTYEDYVANSGTLSIPWLLMKMKFA